MSKKATSPVKRWPGHVILKDPIPLMLVLEYERAIQANRSTFCDDGTELLLSFLDEKEKEAKDKKLQLLSAHIARCPEYIPAKTGTEADGTLLPAIIKCVDEWHLRDYPENVTIDTFPYTPKNDAALIVDWLVGEITEIYVGGDISAAKKNV